MREAVVLALWSMGVLLIGLSCWRLRLTTLVHVLAWVAAGWLAWGWSLLQSSVPTYLAMGFGAACVVAVLGARRPQVWAWHFVVMGYLVMVLTMGIGGQLLDNANMSKLVGTIIVATWIVGWLNYLPTRFGVVVLLSALSFPYWIKQNGGWGDDAARMVFTSIPLWVGALYWRGNGTADGMWRRFRDRYGLIWALRVREQFNTAAKNAGWPVHLAWRGLQMNEGNVRPEVVATLKALLKRFEAPDDNPAELDDTPCGVSH